MKDRSASSSDLDQAVTLSRRLSPRRPIQDARPETETPTEYARFFRGKAPSRKVTPRKLDEDIPLALPRRGIRSWEDLLGWCLTVLRGDAGFVVDGKGFVIAQRGQELERFEMMGAELASAMDQLALARIDAGGLTWVEVVHGKGRTLVMPVAGEAEWSALVVVLTRSPVLSHRLESLASIIGQEAKPLVLSKTT